MNVRVLLQELEAAARHGRAAIENGDYFRHQVPDAEFSRMVPPELEDAVIAAMVTSERWHRGEDGFDLKELWG